MRILLAVTFFWTLSSAFADRTAQGSGQKDAAAGPSPSGQFSTKYFGDENTTDLRDRHEDFNNLRRKFSSNAKLSKSMDAVERALAFFVKNQKRIPAGCGGELAGSAITNKEWIVVTDYTLPDTVPRMFFLNLKSGEVIATAAAHGYGSNAKCSAENSVRCPRKTKCRIPATIGDENGEGTNSRGFYLTDEGYASGQDTFRGGSPTYVRGEDNALFLRGLQTVNKNSYARRTVLHRASYVQEGQVNSCSNSAGCPSIAPSVFEKMKEKIHKGALFYSHTIEDKKMDQPEC